jgi:hypothetical protein
MGGLPGLEPGPQPYQAYSRDAFKLVRKDDQLKNRMEVTVIVRSIPGLSFCYGTRVAQQGTSGHGEGHLAMVPRRRRGTIMWASMQNQPVGVYLRAHLSRCRRGQDTSRSPLRQRPGAVQPEPESAPDQGQHRPSCSAGQVRSSLATTTLASLRQEARSRGARSASSYEPLAILHAFLYSSPPACRSVQGSVQLRSELSSSWWSS